MTDEALLEYVDDRISKFRRQQYIKHHRKQRLDEILERSGVVQKGAIVLTKDQLVDMLDILMGDDDE